MMMEVKNTMTHFVTLRESMRPRSGMTTDSSERCRCRNDSEGRNLVEAELIRGNSGSEKCERIVSVQRSTLHPRNNSRSSNSTPHRDGKRTIPYLTPRHRLLLRWA